jgi:hypothetical protein
MHKPLDALDLARVLGGMNLEGMRESTNVEDRRNMTPRESMNAPSPPAAPLPPLVRTPGDLPSQLGIDSIGKPRR